MSSVFKINKGINRPIEFKGLKAQYITYLAIGVVALLFLFAALYIAGLSLYIGLPLIIILGAALIAYIFYLSKTYGEHGLLKKLARRRIPKILAVKTRLFFFELNNIENGRNNA